jgi:hypothetical protein
MVSTSMTHRLLKPHAVGIRADGRVTWIPEKKQHLFSLYSMAKLDFITEAESVYSAVGAESLYNTDTLSL